MAIKHIIIVITAVILLLSSNIYGWYATKCVIEEFDKYGGLDDSIVKIRHVYGIRPTVGIEMKSTDMESIKFLKMALPNLLRHKLFGGQFINVHVIQYTNSLEIL